MTATEALERLREWRGAVVEPGGPDEVWGLVTGLALVASAVGLWLVVALGMAPWVGWIYGLWFGLSVWMVLEDGEARRLRRSWR